MVCTVQSGLVFFKTEATEFVNRVGSLQTGVASSVLGVFQFI